MELERVKNQCCPICLAPDLSIVRTGRLRTCGHVFCASCIKEWLKVSNTSKRCPLCRRETSAPIECPPRFKHGSKHHPIVILDGDDTLSTSADPAMMTPGTTSSRPILI